jgi:PAS domain S-box-containing protein
MSTASRSDRKVQLAFGAAILALLLGGAVSLRTTIVFSESDRWVQHTQEVLEKLHDVASNMEDVEASCRGFVLTGNESYLDTCRSSKAAAMRDEEMVAGLTVDNPVQRNRIPTLQRLTAEKFALAEKVVSLRRAQGLAAAAAVIQKGSGQQLMGEFQGLIHQMQDEELRLLALRYADASRRLAQTKTVLLLGTLLGVLIAAAAGWTVRRDAIARNRAELAVRDSETLFTIMANNISQMAWMADGSGHIFWFNDRWFDYTGTTLAEVSGWDGQKMLHPDDRQRVMDNLKHCFQTGQIWEDTFPVLGKDGKYRLFLSKAVPIRDTEGKVTQWFGTNTDISESEESGAKYRGLLEAAPDAMVVVNVSGEIVLLNVRAEKEFGYSRDELVGQPVKNIIPEGFAERIIADGTRSAAEALAQQIGTGIELIGRRKDGTEFPIELMLSPLESPEGILVTAAIRDISLRRNAETHLKQMEGRYRGLLEAAPDAMVVVNVGGEIVLLNVRAEKEFGYSRDELIGQKVKNIIPEGFAERIIADGTRSAAEALAQQIGTGIELIGRRKDGTEFPIELMLSPLESPEGILVTAAIRDISVRKGAETHLKQMEGRYRGLLEAAPDAMVVVDGNGQIVLLNVQAEKQFGYDNEELVGQKVKNIIPEGFAERIIADGTRSAAEALAQQIGTGIELIGRRKDGSEFPIELMLSPLESPEGILVTAAIRDISVRKSAETHLAQMEGRYRGLLEAAPDAMVVVNVSGEIVLLNVRAEKEFGYSRDALVGQPVKNIIPEGFAERIIADGTRSAAEALAQQIGTGIELIGRRKDSTEFPIELMLSPLESPEGILVTAAIRDISVRRNAETSLKQMEGRYRGLLEAAPDAMVVVNVAGEIVLLNAQAEKQFGYDSEELVGQQVKNIIPEGFAERIIADGTRSAAEALAQQIGTGIELIGRRKNGTEFPIELMLSPLESPDGILVTAAIRDITARKITEMHLAQMEGRYRGLLEAAPDAMVVVNVGGEIVLLNVQAEKQFGYSRDALIGQKVKNIIPEGFAERIIADGTRSAAEALAQEIGTGIELTGRRKDGTQFPLEIMLSPLDSPDGILVTAAIRDITARKKAEANLLHKIDELYRSNEELGQFAYIASHDLQEPLRMVASYTQLLSRRYKGKLDAEADEFIAFAVDGANRMQRLIQDLLAFSRVGTKGRDLQHTSSERALRMALQNLRGAIEESGALVTHNSLPDVLADDMQLTQLFQNLIGNAIKYQSPGIPRVDISAARNGEGRWMFSVTDNGLGIDPQYFEKIFGMFQRLHKREEFAGTGIGLAICKKIAERHGTNIMVESQLGQGSTFRFALEGSEQVCIPADLAMAKTVAL